MGGGVGYFYFIIKGKITLSFASPEKENLYIYIYDVITWIFFVKTDHYLSSCARVLTGVVCCCCALLRRAGFRNVADEQQRRQWGRDLPIILPVGARRVHRLNHFQQHGAMTGVGSGALAL